MSQLVLQQERLSDLQKVIADWQTELGITDLSVFQGKEKGTGTLTLPRKNRQADLPSEFSGHERI